MNIKFTKFLLLLIGLSFTAIGQTNYYPNVAGAKKRDSLTSWGTDGTGTALSSCALPSQIVNISNSTGISSFSTVGNWTVSGSAAGSIMRNVQPNAFTLATSTFATVDMLNKNNLEVFLVYPNSAIHYIQGEFTLETMDKYRIVISDLTNKKIVQHTAFLLRE